MSINLSSKYYANNIYAYSPQAPRIEPRKVNHFEKPTERKVNEIMATRAPARDRGNSISIFV